MQLRCTALVKHDRRRGGAPTTWRCHRRRSRSYLNLWDCRRRGTGYQPRAVGRMRRHRIRRRRYRRVAIDVTRTAKALRSRCRVFVATVARTSKWSSIARTRWGSRAYGASWSRWSPGAVALDPTGPAGSLLPRLEDVGVTVAQITAREHAQACGAFYDAVMDGSLRHLDQTPLNAAIAGARKRPLGDAWAWSRKASSVDICPLVAVTLAAAHAGATDETSVYNDRGFVGSDDSGTRG